MGPSSWTARPQRLGRMGAACVSLWLIMLVLASAVLAIPSTFERIHNSEFVMESSEFVLATESTLDPHKRAHPARAAYDWIKDTELYEMHREGFSSLESAWRKEEEYALLLRAAGHVTGGDSPLPGIYYAFVPKFVGKIVPANAAEKGFASSSAPRLGWDSPCYFENTASATLPDASGNFDIVLEAGTPRGGILCGDSYLLATTTAWKVIYVSKAEKVTVHWSSKGEDTEDVAEYGVRMFRFTQSITATVESLHQTVLLFFGAMKSVSVPPDAAKRNLDFLKTYANIEMPLRQVTDVAIDESLIQSGDMLGIVRLDGVDPMIMWGTGSHLGHTAIAMRMDGKLYICESQDKLNYWPRGHIQKTEFSEWIGLAKKADYNVVWLPLSKEARSTFNETAAVLAFKNEFEGLAYGYPNLLWGWIDGPTGNLPQPLHEQMVMVAFALGAPVFSKMSQPSILNGAFAQRLGMPNVGTATTREVYAMARKKGVTFAELMSMPEQDKWVYPGGKDSTGPYPAGRAMVCDVFVCAMWRAAGIIHASVQCTEFTPYDLYELAVFESDAAARPEACRTADPASQFCQLLGKYAISLPHWNTVVPFDHMREKCPATAPGYEDRYLAAAYC